jgi:hypothetical protein
MSEIAGAAIGPLRRYRFRVSLRRENLYGGIDMRKPSAPPTDFLFEVVDMAANFSALRSEE